VPRLAVMPCSDSLRLAVTTKTKMLEAAEEVAEEAEAAEVVVVLLKVTPRAEEEMPRRLSRG